MTEQPHLVRFREQDSSEAAIIFVHGFTGHPRKTWREFPKLVGSSPELRQWDVFSFGYQSTSLFPNIRGLWQSNAPIQSLADLFRTRMTYLPTSRYKALALVTHSMGGLIAQRALLDDPQLTQRARFVFMFGTPSQGVSFAGLFSFLHSQASDMDDRSEFITQLREDWSCQYETGLPFKCVSIAGDRDEWVPRTSSLDPFRLADKYVVPGDHVDLVKPRTTDDMSYRIVVETLTSGAMPDGPLNAARLAVEQGEFQSVVDNLYDQRQDLDYDGLTQLALAMEGVGRSEAAIRLLETYANRKSTDAMGVLAGRIKRRWLNECTVKDADRATRLYYEGYKIAKNSNDVEKAYYHAINVAFMALAHVGNPSITQKYARFALHFCNQSPENVPWHPATVGEANLYLGNTDDALKAYEQAVEMAPAPRALRSMYQQAIRVADLMHDDEAAENLDMIFQGSQQIQEDVGGPELIRIAS